MKPTLMITDQGKAILEIKCMEFFLLTLILRVRHERQALVRPPVLAIPKPGLLTVDWLKQY
jgi:hypothetical protein